jgi:hypothetical protein
LSSGAIRVCSHNRGAARVLPYVQWGMAAIKVAQAVNSCSLHIGLFIQSGRLYRVFARRTFVSRLAASPLTSVVATLVNDSFSLDMDHYWPPEKNADWLKRNPAKALL